MFHGTSDRFLVPAGETLHPDFRVALRALDADGLPYAEAWRMLRPVAARLGVPRPSYPTVRRFLLEERARRARRTEVVDRVVVDALKGLAPRLRP